MIGWHLPIHTRHLPHKIDGLPVLFASSVLRRVSVTLLGLFSPIYILGIGRELGLSLQFSVAIVFLYFFLLFSAKLLTIPLAENLSLRYGFNGILLLSGIPFLIFIPLLVWSATLPWLVIPAAVFWGVHNGLFWWGYHGFFVKAGKLISFGEELGAATVFETVAMVITPITGALFAQKFGFSSLFWLAGLIFLFSLSLLVPASQRRPHTDVKLKEVIKLILTYKKAALAYTGNGTEAIWYTTVWPLFLFLTFGSVLRVGGIVSLAFLLAAFMTFLVGVWVDKVGEKRVVAFGSPLLSISWVMRALGQGPALFVVADGLWRFAEGMVQLPLNSLTYKKALEGSTDRAIMFRELSWVLGPVLAMPLLGVWVLLGLPLSWTFFLAAGFALLPLVWVRSKKV